ncbi:MAG: hypothetical protein JWO12_1104 [Frankiales bacterium]|nr:hypothetical protein [Frankiales bacterium]
MNLPPPPLVDEQAVRLLHLSTRHRLDGLLQGEHRGLLPGPGGDPAQARPYTIGDDVRRIDWSVTARTGEVHVRATESERELETWVVVDLSASMAFGSTGSEKRALAIAATAAVCHLASDAGSRVGVLVVAGDKLRRIPARSGRDAALAVLHTLMSVERVDGGTLGLNDALVQLATPSGRRRGVVVVISDLLGPLGPKPVWADTLRAISQRDDVLVWEVLDPRELELPAVGALRVVDPESGRLVEVHTTSKVRSRYAAAAAARRASHADAVRASGASHLVLRTDRDWLIDVAAFTERRRRTPLRIGATT